MSNTAKKIINCAELLFSEQGFSETSIRQITTKAEVNLAAINYHFGSKKNLIQAVFERYLDYFFEQYFKEVSSVGAEASQYDALRAMVAVVVGPESDMIKAQRFMTLLRHAYSQRQGHIRKFIRENYGKESAQLYQNLSGEVSSATNEIEFFWRLQFLLGACMFTLAEFDTLREIAEGEYGDKVDPNMAVELFIPVAAQILKLDLKKGE